MIMTTITDTLLPSPIAMRRDRPISWLQGGTARGRGAESLKRCRCRTHSHTEARLRTELEEQRRQLRQAEADRRRLIQKIEEQGSECRQLSAELEARDSELERVLYTLSHEFKNPLVTIQCFAGLLRRDAASADGERINHDIERITTAGGKLNKLLDALLEMWP